jgi:hypothetical protein
MAHSSKNPTTPTPRRIIGPRRAEIVEAAESHIRNAYRHE